MRSAKFRLCPPLSAVVRCRQIFVHRCLPHSRTVDDKNLSAVHCSCPQLSAVVRSCPPIFGGNFHVHGSLQFSAALWGLPQSSAVLSSKIFDTCPPDICGRVCDFLPRDFLPRDFLPRDFLPSTFYPVLSTWNNIHTGTG